MEAHPGILTTLRGDLSSLISTVAAHSDKSRRALGKIVCAQYDFTDTRGRPRLAGCMKALQLLESEGHYCLPKPQRASPVCGPRLLDSPVPKAVDVPEDVRQLRDLEIILVTSSETRAIWNTLIDAEHPQGCTTFAGAQVRYLIHSAHGYLAAAGFSAAALYLHPRDQWMAWDHTKRAEHLRRVVNLSRFLIRPEVVCKNFASHVLGKVLRCLQSDFPARYGYRPYIVETFAGPDHAGTCFRATGFHYLGLTKGRGRHAVSKRGSRPQKKVFAYELEANWRTYLEVPYVELRPRLEVGAGLDEAHWAEQEFGGAELGDRRRTARLVTSAKLVARTMGNPVTAPPERNPSDAKAYWRFLEKANANGITPADILAPHRERTIERMRTQSVVLCVQDGTTISYSTRSNTEGLDVIGRNQTASEAKGVRLHATTVLNEEGLPLGVLRCSFGTQTCKTRNWIHGLHDIDEAVATLPRKTEVFSVMDREADAFEILAQQRTPRRTHLLVRAKYDRKLAQRDQKQNKDALSLFKKMRRAASAGVIHLEVQALSRRQKSGRVTHKGRPARNARMEVRFCKVMLPPTKDRTQAPMPVWGIYLSELNPPENATPIQWYLLTTKELSNVEEARELVGYYTLRWRIEDTFRVLKTGCQVEKLRLQKAESLHRAITLNMVVAWRIMLMTLLGRVAAELPPEVLFTESELQMMRVYARKYNVPVHTDLTSAVLIVAMMGGYMNRKLDPPPGYTLLWRGYANLKIRTVAYEELGAFFDLVERPPP